MRRVGGGEGVGFKLLSWAALGLPGVGGGRGSRQIAGEPVTPRRRASRDAPHHHLPWQSDGTTTELPYRPARNDWS